VVFLFLLLLLGGEKDVFGSTEEFIGKYRSAEVQEYRQYHYFYSSAKAIVCTPELLHFCTSQ